jgi:AhpD family alkylhydroperoxidase
VLADRINYAAVAPDGMVAMRQLQRHVDGSTLEPVLLELVKTRASQINGCAYCVDMHTKDARVGGETEQRLYALPVWRDTPFYTARERAALSWTEAVTLIAQGPVSDEIYEEARRHFSERELIELTMAIVAINGWNRLSVAFRRVPGSYQPRAR